MPFGLITATVSFQRGLDVILTKLKWEMCLVYRNDIVNISNSMEKHIEFLHNIPISLKQARVKVQIKKCKLLMVKVEYLSHIIRLGKLETDYAPS